MALSNIASWTKGGKSSACGTAEKGFGLRHCRKGFRLRFSLRRG